MTSLGPDKLKMWSPNTCYRQHSWGLLVKFSQCWPRSMLQCDIITRTQWDSVAENFFMIHQTFVRWALYILFKFVKSLIRHLGLAIRNVRCVPWFSWTLSQWDKGKHVQGLNNKFVIFIQILMNDILSTSFQISLQRMPQDITVGYGDGSVAQGSEPWTNWTSAVISYVY